MKKLPKSIRKHIRKEKARLRREVLDVQEQERQIAQLYKQFLPKGRLEKPTVEENPSLFKKQKI